jgi:hypothetical protein
VASDSVEAAMEAEGLKLIVTNFGRQKTGEFGERTPDSVVLKIHKDFKMVPACETDGINKNCEVISCE